MLNRRRAPARSLPIKPGLRSAPGMFTLKFGAMETKPARLAFPIRPDGPLRFRQFLHLVRDNTLATYPAEAFDEDIIAGRLLWRRRFIINEPSGIRHVLLDNAANYRKSELTRRLIEPGWAVVS